jgi:hypothetical protein
MKDWAISNQTPNLAMIEYGGGSETRRLRISNDGLINRMKFKV